jgi:hypothetical protein
VNSSNVRWKASPPRSQSCPSCYRAPGNPLSKPTPRAVREWRSGGRQAGRQAKLISLLLIPQQSKASTWTARLAPVRHGMADMAAGDVRQGRQSEEMGLRTDGGTRWRSSRRVVQSHGGARGGKARLLRNGCAFRLELERPWGLGTGLDRSWTQWLVLLRGQRGGKGREGKGREGMGWDGEEVGKEGRQRKRGACSERWDCRTDMHAGAANRIAACLSFEAFEVNSLNSLNFLQWRWWPVAAAGEWLSQPPSLTSLAGPACSPAPEA